MVASNEWTEWHLTPNGWVAGSRREDNVGITKVPDPPGSVAVYTVHEVVGAIGGRWDRDVSLTRKIGTQEEIDRLLAQYGSCPNHV